jgi:thiol-disulfide isomerase/thioredoxin
MAPITDHPPLLGPGDTAPDFIVPTLDGHAETRLAALLEPHTQPVSLTFWASWCEFCQADMPRFDQIFLRYQDRVTFLAVTSEDADSRADVEAYVRSAGLHLPIYSDADGSIADAYGVVNVPTLFLIDAHGRIAARLKGDDDLAAALDRLLAS